MLRHRDTGFRLYLQSASLCLRNAGMEARDFNRVRLHWEQATQIFRKEERLYRIGTASMERMRGIEPPSQAWEAGILPMNYIRERI